MIPDLSKAEIYLRPGSTDMRKAINGLSAIVEEQMESDPYSGALFLFANRRRDILKILYWDRNGFCLWQKRLERHKFPWPKSEAEAMSLSRKELDWLLSGIDFFHRHEKLTFFA